MSQTCEQPIRGRYVQFQKTPISGNIGATTLQVCEFQCYVCQPNYHIGGNNKLITFNNDTFTKSNFPVCTRCPATEECLYGCDNLYGCLNREAISYNLATRSPESYFSSGRDAYKVTDSISFIHSAEFCFETLQKSGEKAHFWRVHLDDLSSVQNVTITGNNLLTPPLRDLDVLVTRDVTVDGEIHQEGEERCAFYPGEYSRQVAGVELYCLTCLDYAHRPAGCPKGRYVTVGVSSSLTVMRLCEVEIWGTPQKDLIVGDTCMGLTCGFLSCRRPAVCHENTGVCMHYTGGPCFTNNHCLPLGETICERGTCKTMMNFMCKNAPMHCATPLVCGKEYICKATIRGDCVRDSDCVSVTPEVPDSGVLCDFFNTCKLAVGLPCVQKDVCVAGSMCTNGRCSECKPVLSKSNGLQCSPTFYGQSCNATLLCDPSTPFCGPNNTCECENGHLPSAEEFSCGSWPGSPCDPTLLNQCLGTMICTGGFCKIPHLASCRGSAASHCAEGICDPLTQTCKKSALGTCTNKQDCVTGLLCLPVQPNGRQCKFVLGSNCTIGPQCGDPVDPLACSPTLGKCVLDLGSFCNDEGIRICNDGLVCSTTLSGVYRCSIPLGDRCNSATAKHCIQYTVCDRVGKCSRIIGSECLVPWHNQTGDSECGPDAICDVDRICRWKERAVCTFDAYCTVGAFCDSSTNRCVCSPGMIINGTFGTCVQSTACGVTNPCMVGASCAFGSRICVENAECNASSLTCVCSKGFSVTLRATCLPSASERCALTAEEKKKKEEEDRKNGVVVGPKINKSWLLESTPEGNSGEELCAPGLVCDAGDKKCGIIVGYPCFLNHPAKSYCERGSLCDVIGVCKLQLNADCKKYVKHCKDGLVCSVFGKCRVPVNKVGTVQPDVCYSSEQCIPGAVCIISKDSETAGTCICNSLVAVIDPRDNQCYPKPASLGGLCPSSCTVANSECRDGYDKDKRCLCADGFDPEENTLICKTGSGVTCTSTEQCVNGTVCDNGACKLDIGQPCTGFGQGICISKAECGEPGICRRGAGADCKNDTECSGGSDCPTSKCQCNSAVTTEKTGYCYPKSGRVGHGCNTTEDCLAGTDCIEGKCACPPGVAIDKTELRCCQS